MIRIVADSTCDLSADLIQKYGIRIASLHIVLGEKEYLDGVEITPDEIYEWADTHGETPKTSAIGFEDASEVIRQLSGTDDEMIIFTISEKMSTTANVFRMAAEELGLDERVTVIDSANLSTGISLMIIKVAVMVKEGKRFDAVFMDIDYPAKMQKNGFGWSEELYKIIWNR